jgi:hypothetical protein
VTIFVSVSYLESSRYREKGKRQARQIHGAPAQGEPVCQPSNQLVSMRTELIQSIGCFGHRWVLPAAGLWMG